MYFYVVVNAWRGPRGGQDEALRERDRKGNRMHAIVWEEKYWAWTDLSRNSGQGHEGKGDQS